MMSVTGSEELVDVSQQPDERREEISPSRAMSREDDREDFPEDAPREEPARDGSFGGMPLHRLVRPRLGRRHQPVGCLSRGGDTPVDVAALLKGGDVLTDPSGFCTCSHTSLHFFPAPGRGPEVAEFNASELGLVGPGAFGEGVGAPADVAAMPAPSLSRLSESYPQWEHTKSGSSPATEIGRAHV